MACGVWCVVCGVRRAQEPARAWSGVGVRSVCEGASARMRALAEGRLVVGLFGLGRQAGAVLRCAALKRAGLSRAFSATSC